MGKPSAVGQPTIKGQLSLSSSRGRLMSSKLHQLVLWLFIQPWRPLANYAVKASVVCLQVKLCDPHLSALEVIEVLTTRRYTNLHLPLPLITVPDGMQSAAFEQIRSTMSVYSSTQVSWIWSRYKMQQSRRQSVHTAPKVVSYRHDVKRVSIFWNWRNFMVTLTNMTKQIQNRTCHSTTVYI